MCDLMSSTSSSYAAQNINTANLNNSVNLCLNNPKAAKLLADYKQIILELRAQNFDVIRFATYRTASKLRFIQKKLNLHLIDLWNVIETFRDNNLHTIDILNEIEITKLESCIQNMYLQLNKRLAFNQHINVDTQTQLLLAWLLNIYDKNRLSKIKVISVKVALTTMCAGKLIDKIKYIFTQISDPTKNCLIIQKFEYYLKELLALPKSVFEEPSFGYNENLSRTCFDLNAPVRLDDFLSVVLSDVGPACFIWLNIFHRFTIVQNVTHPITCSVCERSHFNGFRYKCQKCRKYQLCQDCFWRGRISHSHQLTHQMKEYTSYKSAAKQFSNSLRRSFFCKPNKQAHQSQHRPSQQPLNLSTKSQSQQAQFSKYNTQNDNMNNIMASTSNSLNNNSDYNLLYRKEKPMESKLQTQTLNNINSSINNQQPTITTTATSNSCNIPINNNDIYSTLSKSLTTPNNTVSKPKKIVHQLSTNIDDSYYDSSNNIIQQPLDLTHIVPPQDIKQSQMIMMSPTLIQQQQQQLLQKELLANNKLNKSNQIYSNTLSMTRSKHNSLNNDNLCSNIFASFLLSNNNLMNNQNIHGSTSSSSNNNNDEHNLIANYCSRLADFYVKNPHLSSSPTSNTPPPLLSSNSSLTGTNTNLISSSTNPSTGIYSNVPSKLKSNLKSSQTYQQPLSNTTSSSTSQAPTSFELIKAATNRTASLSRHLWSSSRANKLNQNGTNTITNGDTSQQIYAQNILNQKNNTYTTRSLSESNFRNNMDGDYRESTIDDKLLREKREIVAKLEQRNKEILKEIKKLKLKQLSNQSLDLDDHTPLPSSQSTKYNQYYKSRESTPLNSSILSKRSHYIDQNTLNLVEQQNKTTASMINKTNNLKQQLANSGFSSSNTIVNPHLIAELQTLKQKKGQLENRMQLLENSRDELIDRLSQLDTLIKPAKNKRDSVQQTSQRIIQTNSLRTTPNSSPRSINTQKYSTLAQSTLPSGSPINGGSISPQQSSTSPFVPIVSASVAMQMPSLQPQQQQKTQQRSWSTPSTPALYEFHPTRLKINNNQLQLQQQQIQQQIQQQQQQQLLLLNKQQPYQGNTSLLSLNGLSNTSISNGSSIVSNYASKIDLNQMNSSSHNLRNLRNDLLIAADSVTNAMQSLVKELNSENESYNTNTSDDEDENPIDPSMDVNSYVSSLKGDVLNDIRYQSYTTQSASATPVTFRKNIQLNTRIQSQHIKPTDDNLLLLNNRNAINFDNFNLDGVIDMDSVMKQLPRSNNEFVNNNNYDDNENNMYENEDRLIDELNNEEEDEDDNDDENIEAALYENYLLTESVIDDCNSFMNKVNNQDLMHFEQGYQEQKNQIIADSEQVVSWRRELEQRLIEDSNDNNCNNNNNSNITNNSNNESNLLIGTVNESSSQIS